MTPYQRELIEVLRRIAERGRAHAVEHDDMSDECSYNFTDLFQHILDELERLRSSRST